MILRFRNEQEELAEFKETIAADYFHKFEYFRQCFEASRRRGTRMSVEMALHIHRVCWEGLALYFAGLPPEEKDELADQLVPFWIEYKAVRARVLELAQRALAEFAEAGEAKRCQ